MNSLDESKFCSICLFESNSLMDVIPVDIKRKTAPSVNVIFGVLNVLEREFPLGGIYFI